MAAEAAKSPVKKRPAEDEAAGAVPKASNTGNLNQDFCDFLLKLADHEKNVIRNIHKSNIYRKAAAVLAKHHVRISSGDEAKKLEGIGTKIGAKIDEFIQTGHLTKLDKIEKDPTSQAIQLLTSVVGIGPVAAHAFVARGVTTIEQLRLEPGLNHSQQIGVRYYDELKERIPREEMDRLKAHALTAIRRIEPAARVEVCGSYRRGAASSGDLDVLMALPGYTSADKAESQDALERVVDEMKKNKFVTDVLSLGHAKFMGVCQDPDTASAHHRRIDIRLWPADQFIPALLYFTGSDELNKAMRRRAIEKNFHLNEYCIKPVGATGVHGEALPVESEQDIFDYLEMDYLPPEKR
eukprot:m.236798 g.236798  ORF g.236798 m.236798 type:complete len:352 (-) comp20781_c0_seq1:27-1082(-)